MKTIIKRLSAKTPKFFRRIRLVALILAATSGAILSSDIAGPVLQDIARYLGLASAVLIAAAQDTVTSDPE